MTYRENQLVRILNKHLIMFLALLLISAATVSADDAFLTVKPTEIRRSDYQPVCRMGNLGWSARLGVQELQRRRQYERLPGGRSAV